MLPRQTRGPQGPPAWAPPVGAGEIHREDCDDCAIPPRRGTQAFRPGCDPNPSIGQRTPGKACLIGAAALALAIAPARAQTLLDELAGAYATNPQIRTARAQLEATAEDAPQALAGWRPTVTVTTSGGPEQVDFITKTSVGDIAGTQYLHQQLYQVAVTQPLYSGGQTVAKTGQADHLFAAQQWSLMSTEQVT